MKSLQKQSARGVLHRPSEPTAVTGNLEYQTGIDLGFRFTSEGYSLLKEESSKQPNEANPLHSRRCAAHGSYGVFRVSVFVAVGKYLRLFLGDLKFSDTTVQTD